MKIANDSWWRNREPEIPGHVHRNSGDLGARARGRAVDIAPCPISAAVVGGPPAEPRRKFAPSCYRGKIGSVQMDLATAVQTRNS